MLWVSENRILSQIFGTKRDENGEWRGLQNEELYSLFCSPNTVRLIKSIRLWWIGYLAKMEEGMSPQNFNKETYWKESFRKA